MAGQIVCPSTTQWHQKGIWSASSALRCRSSTFKAKSNGQHSTYISHAKSIDRIIPLALISATVQSWHMDLCHSWPDAPVGHLHSLHSWVFIDCIPIHNVLLCPISMTDQYPTSNQALSRATNFIEKLQRGFSLGFSANPLLHVVRCQDFHP